MAHAPSIRIGTRGSALARWQAEWVAAALVDCGAEVELIPIVTTGDTQQTGPVGAIGAPGVFTKEIQRALLDGRIDLAVHSLKDLPTDPVEELLLAAVPPREAVGDALISRRFGSLEALPPGAVVGTGSLRRRAQLLHVRPDLSIRDIRGNIDTRLRKLDEDQYEAIVLAEAGLRRLGLEQRITQRLAPPMMLPAVGQGALGIEARTKDDRTRHIVGGLDDAATHAAVAAERALLARLRGGCLAPVGAWGRLESGRLQLSARVLSHDGRESIEAADAGDPAEAEPLGQRVADQLIEQGAAKLIEASRGAS